MKVQRASQLLEHGQRLEAALENMSQALCMVDAFGGLTIYNRNFATMLLIAPDRCVAGTSYFELISRSPVFEDAASGTIRSYAAEYFLVTHSRQRVCLQQVWFDGRVISISHQPLPIGGFIETFEDVTELRKADARIAHMALHDALTDLPNRVKLHQHLHEAFARHARYALLYVDLDYFKTVNDTLGHATGDTLLQQVARRLCAHVRAQDMVARLGGDEFALLVCDFRDSDDVASLAGRLIRSVSEPYDLDGQEVIIGASVGIALAPDNANEPRELIRFADLALYGAKSAGRGQYCFFAPHMEQAMRTRHALEHELRCALANNEFELFYQPFISLHSRRISGFEALLRWRSPNRGLVEPGQFIPLAQELGLIVPIGEWVLREACSNAAHWKDSIRVAVNLSAAQFRRGDLVGAVRRALDDSGLSPRRLELEITESLMLENAASVLNTLHQLRALGVSIAMDDFGTGHSSLSCLTMFPFERIKIDRTFTAAIEHRPESLAVVRAVIGMCIGLGMVSTAEGVETTIQLQLLSRECCDEVQGYLFSSPEPKSAVEGLLAAWPNGADFEAAVTPESVATTEPQKTAAMPDMPAAVLLDATTERPAD